MEHVTLGLDRFVAVADILVARNEKIVPIPRLDFCIHVVFHHISTALRFDVDGGDFFQDVVTTHQHAQNPVVARIVDQRLAIFEKREVNNRIKLLGYEIVELQIVVPQQDAVLVESGDVGVHMLVADESGGAGVSEVAVAVIGVVAVV